MLALGYLIEVQICIAVLYLLYIALLHRNVAHKAARTYIITMFPIACLLPLLSIPILPAPTTYNTLAVSEISLDAIASTAPIVVPEQSPQINYLLLIYLLGVVVMSIWIIIGAVRLYLLLRKSRPERVVGLKIIFADQKVVAYSVFDYIFIKAALRDSSIIKELLAHEVAHIRLKHTLDLIYMSVLRIVLWFNPLVWHSLSLLRQVHEYQVDEEVINQGCSINKYLNLLILSEAGISPEFASPLSYSLTKKRLIMLNQKQGASSRNRLLLIAPVLALLMSAFSITTRAEVVQVEITDPQIEILYAETKTLQEDGAYVFRKLNSTKGAKNNNIDQFQDMASKESKEPLIIDVGKEENVKSIAAKDSKEFTVLKDGAARKAYGDKVVNGVVIVTTQKADVHGMKPRDPVSDQKRVPDKGESVHRMLKSEGAIGEKAVNKKPIIIIDGKEGELESVKPQNIKSFDVLKNEYGCQKYGERGENGVILITTHEADSNTPKVDVRKSYDNSNTTETIAPGVVFMKDQYGTSIRISKDRAYYY